MNQFLEPFMTEKETTNPSKRWIQIIRQIWDDPSYKDKLIQNPHQVLKDHGIEIPESVRITIHENSATERHFVLPEKPDKELSDEFLSHIVAGLI